MEGNRGTACVPAHLPPFPIAAVGSPIHQHLLCTVASDQEALLCALIGGFLSPSSSWFWVNQGREFFGSHCNSFSASIPSCVCILEAPWSGLQLVEMRLFLACLWRLQCPSILPHCISRPDLPVPHLLGSGVPGPTVGLAEQKTCLSLFRGLSAPLTAVFFQ